MLLVHGTGDRVLPPAGSGALHAMAGPPKGLVLLPGAGHTLDEVAPALQSLAGTWLRVALPEPGPARARPMHRAGD